MVLYAQIKEEFLRDMGGAHNVWDLLDKNNLLDQSRRLN